MGEIREWAHAFPGRVIHRRGPTRERCTVHELSRTPMLHDSTFTQPHRTHPALSLRSVALVPSCSSMPRCSVSEVAKRLSPRTHVSCLCTARTARTDTCWTLVAEAATTKLSSRGYATNGIRPRDTKPCGSSGAQRLNCAIQARSSTVAPLKGSRRSESPLTAQCIRAAAAERVVSYPVLSRDTQAAEQC